MDTFRAAGSDRKLSELGLDLPDFLDPVIDAAELYSSAAAASSSSLDFYSGRGQFQSYPYNHDDPGYHQHQTQHPTGHLLQHGHQQQQQQQPHARLATKEVTNRSAGCYVVDAAGGGGSRFGQNNARRFQTIATHENDDDDLLATDLRLVDVVNDVNADDDEVVLGNGWLDDILDEEDDDDDEDGQTGNHVTNDDVIELHVSDEHSYSLASDTADDDLESYDVKMESDYIDVDSGLFEMISPAELSLLNGTELASAVSMSGISDLAATSLGARALNKCDDVIGHSVVKSEPVDASSTDSCYSMSPGHSHVSCYDVADHADLPLTPPSSSSCGSESDAAGLSPRHTPPTTPTSPRHVITSAQRAHYQQQYHHHNLHHHHQTSSGGMGGASHHNVWTATLSSNGHQPFPTNPIPSSGILILSEEEKRTLVAEGYAVPSKLPLTKQEEKNLKKIRRKIKNKISAQESRRKKKEYMETLEKKVEVVSIENISLRKKIDLLENNNRSLASQLQKLQSLASKLTTQMQAASCIAVN